MELNRSGPAAAGSSRQASTTEIVQEIVDACLLMVGLPYDGEPVDQLEHALQCAALAADERPDDDEYVVACLLHDIARTPAVSGVQYDAADEHHGESGARWLTPRVGARVAWLAEQHVDAKRYLVSTDSAYRGRLSEVSLKTLEQQGGAMTTVEVSQFRRHKNWREAVALRVIDDQGKVPGLEVPDIDSYRGRLASVISAHGHRPQ